MENHSPSPIDENAEILQRMRESGDDLSLPRILDFSFVFQDRQSALAFAELIDDRESEICISFFREKKMWQAIVKNQMIPEHGRITQRESALTAIADKVGGRADGWGCILKKNQPKAGTG